LTEKKKDLVIICFQQEENMDGQVFEFHDTCILGSLLKKYTCSIIVILLSIWK